MPKILIIEDDPALQRGLKDSFADEGYEVLVASDGTIGLDLAPSVSPDLLLLFRRQSSAFKWQHTREKSFFFHY